MIRDYEGWRIDVYADDEGLVTIVCPHSGERGVTFRKEHIADMIVALKRIYHDIR